MLPIRAYLRDFALTNEDYEKGGISDLEIRKTPDQILKEIREEERRKTRGKLKIFFGYAAGVGKTYSMLKAAHAAKDRGVDVVAGYIEPHARPQTTALISGLEVLPIKNVPYNNIVLHEFDIDAALKRHPQLILVDELAHTNASSSRHKKRYKDIEELLDNGIDVYTTVNVQHIESLNDIVSSITGIRVRERIPDSVFDSADQVELIDIEPRDLLDRLNAGKVYKETQAKRAVQNFFSVENLTALREIALRRCADRMNLITENNRIKNRGDVSASEHILVCLSSAPSNPKIIRTAARMAGAFRATFTALFVETSDFSNMSDENINRLRENMHLARQLGAHIETVYGDDVPLQIAEFAKLFGISKIVIGRSAVPKVRFFAKQSFTDRLIEAVPNMDVYIIPDAVSGMGSDGIKNYLKPSKPIFSVSDTLKSVGILAGSTAIGLLFQKLGFTDANIIIVYILSTIFVASVTKHKIYCFFSSFLSVVVFNFLFTEPRWSFQFYDDGYPVTFLIMFSGALFVSSLTARLKDSAKQSAMSAYRTKILFETNQLLQQKTGKTEIASAMATQLNKLLNRDIVVYFNNDGELSEPMIFSVSETDGSIISQNERTAALWVLKNNKRAGATTDTLSSSKCLYLAVRVNNSVYAVVGISMNSTPLDSFENSILLSILGECALALENEKNSREKEKAAVLVKNEQIKETLLKVISNDLNSPLKSICKDARALIEHTDSLDDNSKKKYYHDIYKNSIHLVNLSENFIDVSKLEDGFFALNTSSVSVADIFNLAKDEMKNKFLNADILFRMPENIVYVKADKRLISQVIINLVENAVIYVPENAEIIVSSEIAEDFVEISVSVNGVGMSDMNKKKVYDIQNSEAQRIESVRNGLEVGLSLCKSIINEHGGKITARYNDPQWLMFTFSLQKVNEHN